MVNWKPITELDSRSHGLSHRGVHGLAGIWRNQEKTLRGSPALESFEERYAREWAVETGIIERLYDLDEGTTQVLLERGFEAALIPHSEPNKPPDWVSKVLNDNREALSVLFDFVGGQRELTTSFIKELHVLLTRHQDTVEAIDSTGRRVVVPLLKGEWKKQSNNPLLGDGTTHTYCPPEQTASEMDRLIELNQELDAQEVPVEVHAAWLHHRFTQIHPFQDGNGRVARSLATLIFVRGNWLPLIVHRNDRDKYLHSLREADQGEIEALVTLFAHIQERSFSRALISAVPRAETLLDAAAEMLRDSRGASEREKVAVSQLGVLLFNCLNSRMSELVKHSRAKFSSEAIPRHRAEQDTSKWNDELASTLPGDLAPLDTMWQGYALMAFPSPADSEFLFSVHCPGPLFRGVLVVVPVYRGTGESGEIFDLVADPFVCGVDESHGNVLSRFSEWQETAITRGISRWVRLLRKEAD